MSSAGGASVVDVRRTTREDRLGRGGASGATGATTGAGELALGVYADSGFGDAITPGSGFTAPDNVSNAGNMELLVEDR